GPGSCPATPPTFRRMDRRDLRLRATVGRPGPDRTISRHPSRDSRPNRPVCSGCDRRHLHAAPAHRDLQGEEICRAQKRILPKAGKLTLANIHFANPRKGMKTVWWEVLFCVLDRKSTRLNSSHVKTSYAVFCLT